MFVFYWTEDNDTKKGEKCYTETEAQREDILTHYFEASMSPIEGIKYPRKPIRFTGVNFRRVVGV